jgi:hypothetical protein
MKLSTKVRGGQATKGKQRTSDKTDWRYLGKNDQPAM